MLKNIFQKLGRKEHFKIPKKGAFFSSEQRKSLEEKGYIIYKLTGQSIASLRDAGHEFQSRWHIGEAFEQVPSIGCEVAINPNLLFLPESNFKTLEEQVAIVKQFGENLGAEIKGVSAILGTATDYAELAFLHYASSGSLFFGDAYHSSYTRTTTSTGGVNMTIVGNFNTFLGLNLMGWGPMDDRFDIWATSLVVPR